VNALFHTHHLLRTGLARIWRTSQHPTSWPDRRVGAALALKGRLHEGEGLRL